jgi:hypothetical protein
MKHSGRSRLATYHALGGPLPGPATSPTAELKLPDATVRLLDRRVHVKALDQAGRKLMELLRRSGRRNSR